MAWRENLVPASFRGVEFSIDGHESPLAGRRVQTHEYPGQDRPFTEDLGRRTKRYTFDAWVLGAEYMDQRDRLIEACDMPGPGELVHPYYGTRQVMCTACDVTERTQDGGMARFSLEFTDAGTNQFPLDRPNTTAIVEDAAGAANAAIVDQFQGEFEI